MLASEVKEIQAKEEMIKQVKNVPHFILHLVSLIKAMPLNKKTKKIGRLF